MTGRRKLNREHGSRQVPIFARRSEEHTDVAPAHLSPAKLTAVFDSYWRLAAARQEIFFRRAEQAPPPWTSDPILAEYKFTNAYRASDRVSQFLIRNVIYREDLPVSITEVAFRILLFKFFNKIETWRLLENAFGCVTYEDYDFDAYDRVLTAAMNAGQRIYSAAYIMPSGVRSFGESRKHRNHLLLLERMMRDELPKRLSSAKRMHDAFELIRSYPMIGDFLAYQYVTDINYSTVTDFKEHEFVIPGPGALDGIRKCFLDTGGLSGSDVIRLMMDRQELEFERLGIRFRDLWGRRLQLIDCQNLFCEVDKYARVRHPDIQGRSGRTRIKQRFAANVEPIAFWYPPKWELNEKIESGMRSCDATAGLSD